MNRRKRKRKLTAGEELRREVRAFCRKIGKGEIVREAEKVLEQRKRERARNAEINQIPNNEGVAKAQA